jgi:hypothetical protein
MYKELLVHVQGAFGACTRDIFEASKAIETQAGTMQYGRAKQQLLVGNNM